MWSGGSVQACIFLWKKHCNCILSNICCSPCWFTPSTATPQRFPCWFHWNRGWIYHRMLNKDDGIPVLHLMTNFEQDVNYWGVFNARGRGAHVYTLVSVESFFTLQFVLWQLLCGLLWPELTEHLHPPALWHVHTLESHPSAESSDRESTLNATGLRQWKANAGLPMSTRLPVLKTALLSYFPR